MRVLILSANAGGGHRAVSRAVGQALQRLGAEVTVADLFGPGPPSLLDPVVRLYGPMIRLAPAIYGGVYHLSDHPLVYEALIGQTRIRFRRRLRELIASQRPAAIVSAYPVYNRALLDTLKGLGDPAPAVALVTELVTVHRSWAERGFSRWSVATSAVQDALIRLGVSPGRVACPGLPVDERFGRVAATPREVRVRLGLDPDRPAVLVVGGAEGAGRLERLVPALAAASPESQLMVVCGNNRRARAQLEGLPLYAPAVIYGFVENMPELMHAADIVLTKGGPQTIAETLASGRPIVVFDSLPGQEEGNAEFVERHGAGVDGRSLSQALKAVRRLVARPEERAAMAARARALARPHAAQATAEAVLGIAAEAAQVRVRPRAS